MTEAEKDMQWSSNAKNHSRGRYHPSRKRGHSRINGRQKFLRLKAWEKYTEKKKKEDVEPIDTSKSDWSLEK